MTLREERADGAGSQAEACSPNAPRAVERSLIVRAAESWDGKSLPPYPAGTPCVTILRVTIPPRERLAMHAHPVINAGVVLSGELTVVAADGAERTFRCGEGIVEMVGTPHYGENRGDEPLDLVMFYAGTESLPLSEEIR